MSKLYKMFTNEELLSQQEMWFKGFYLATKAGRQDKVEDYDKMIQDISDELIRRAKYMDEGKIWKKPEAPEHIKDEFARQCYEVGRKRIKLASIN